MNVELEDGTVIENVPEGTTQTQLMAKVQKMRGTAPVRQLAKNPYAGSAVASPPPAKAQSKYSPFQNYVGSAIEPNLALLTGSLATPIAGLRGLATGAGNILGMTKADPAEAIRSTQEALTYAPRTEGGKTAMEAISYPFRKLSEGAEYLGDKAMDVTGSPTVGAITKTAIESAPMLAGMRLGGTDAAIKSAQSGVNAVKSLGHVADVLKPTGPANILKRGQQKLLGNDPAVEARVVAATENAPEIVRGSKPTVMEAVSEIPEATGLAKHQQQIARKEGLSPAFSARAAEQQAAREAAMSDVAQTPNLLAQAVARRKAKADPLYQQARAGGDVVNAGPLVDKISDVLKRNPGNRELVTELTNVKKGLIDSEGFIRTNAEEVASVMDGLKKAIADENNKFIRGNLTEIKNDLAAAIPNYQKAQKTFANESKPINEMQVGQELERALKSPSGEVERAATFQQAIRNAPQTIKKATGQPRFTELSEVLPPSKLSKVEAVAKELARKEASERLAGHTGNAAIEATDITHGMIPPMLARVPMIGRWLADTAAEHVQPKIEALASELYRNPKMQADFLRTVPRSKQAMIIEALTKRAAPYAVTGAITNAAAAVPEGPTGGQQRQAMVEALVRKGMMTAPIAGMQAGRNAVMPSPNATPSVVNPDTSGLLNTATTKLEAQQPEKRVDAVPEVRETSQPVITDSGQEPPSATPWVGAEMRIGKITEDEKTQMKDFYKFEDFRSKPYRDAKGWAIGYGTQLDKNLSEAEIGKLSITQEDANAYAIMHLRRQRAELENYDWFSKLDRGKQNGVAQLAYTMGVEGMLGFPKLIQALKELDNDKIAAEIKNSDWYKQVHANRGGYVIRQLQGSS